MTDRGVNPAGCLGRVLIFAGLLWLAVALAGGMLAVQEEPTNAVVGFFAAILPALFLIVGGIALRRRARAATAARPEEVLRPAQTRTPPRLPGTPPPPSTEPVPLPEPEVIRPNPPVPPHPPKQARTAPLEPYNPRSSREMVEEARKKWGRRS